MTDDELVAWAEYAKANDLPLEDPEYILEYSWDSVRESFLGGWRAAKGLS